MDYATAGATLRELLALQHAPVAIAFVDAPPAGVARAAAGPASCSYWSRAAAGETFYTVADDHQRCPIGAHTHNVPLGPTAAAELPQMIEQMVKLQYIDGAEVPHIPTRKTPLAVAVYAPLDRCPVAPDVVVVRGDARQTMLLAEAARAAGVADGGAAMGRPACAMLPAAIDTGRAHMSLGCIGNRVYTGLGDGELYWSIPGARLAAIAEKLAAIVGANRALAEMHAARARA